MQKPILIKLLIIYGILKFFLIFIKNSKPLFNLTQ